MNFSLDNLLNFLKTREEIDKFGDDLRIVNLPRQTCGYDGKPLELLSPCGVPTSIPRAFYVCHFCNTVYNLPVK